MVDAGAEAHVFVEDLAAPRLSEDDFHHLSRVLRLGPGASVTVADGRGAWRWCRLAPGPELEVSGDVVVDAPPQPPITVAFALVKGDRPEWVVQKLTELGADRIVPFVAERSVVRWDGAKAGRQLGRLARIAREAAMQCRRSRIPAIGLTTLTGEADGTVVGEAVGGPHGRAGGTTAGGAGGGPQPGGVPGFPAVAALPRAALADRSGGRPTLATPTIVVGPEGGWTARERAIDIPRVCLSEHVLRAETAAVTAGALLAALRSHLLDG